MPQLETHTFATQIFWLIVTFVPLYLLLWKVALPRIADILESRQNRIDHDLARADTLKVEAEEVMASYREEQAKARAEATAQGKEPFDIEALAKVYGFSSEYEAKNYRKYAEDFEYQYYVTWASRVKTIAEFAALREELDMWD